ncbi:hypothetical protein IFR04_013415 [Cadophora malorum]|uniref:SprT-like domain-containing protein n=1 Tax=Cadophora malorum TaxID=108018 RepID=A0A8H7T6X0_9HELO|nr:hypothetical protein IFR04_013415 [Cadophora malorum]
MAPTTAKKSSNHQNKDHKLGYIDPGTHPKIEDDLPDAIQGKYCGKFFSKTLRDNAKTEIKTRLGDSEMRILGLPIPPIETEAEAKVMVLRFFPIFDRAFFINLVGKIVTNPVEIYDDSEDTGKFCYSGDHIIRLNISIPDWKSPVGEKLLCTLLHEMLHVFLEYYTCKCRKCEKRTARTGGPGKTNHGFAFCNAMIGLQEALQREVKWKVDCDLAHSVRVEMEASGWEPTEQQLKR